MNEHADVEFLRSLADGTLAELTHAGHVRIAWLVLHEESLLPALERVCRELRTYAAWKGRPEIFHETITWAFTLLIHERVERGRGGGSWVEFLELNPDLADGVPALHALYDPATLDSELARRTFVLPDARLIEMPHAVS